MKMLQHCPNCSSHWAPGSEEWQFQECDCCGYPHHDEDYDDSDDEYYSDDDAELPYEQIS